MDKRGFCVRKSEDLLCECGNLAGLDIENCVEDYLYCSVSRAKLGKASAALVGRSVGNYTSVFFANASELCSDAENEIIETLSAELRLILENVVGGTNDFRILVAGLGNRRVTHDSLGARVCDMLLPSDRMLLASVGVEGESGIPTPRLVHALAKASRVDLVVAVDSLAARSFERVGRVIQIADSGILQGSGVGVHKVGLNLESVGVPVLAVGFPLALIPEGNECDEGYLSVPCDLPLLIDSGGRIISSALRKIFCGNKPKTE